MLNTHPFVIPFANVAVPAASLAKLNVNVSHAPATVVTASVSHVSVLLEAFSTFNRIGVPAVGDQTLTVISVSVSVKGITEANPNGVEIVVPAHTGAVIGLTTSITIFVGSVGSTVIVDTLFPKSDIV